MDSGLLWSAPAKRRGCIEPQLRGIPMALAGNPGPFGSTRAAATALSPGRNTFVGDGCVVQSKAAAGSCHLADPRLMPRAVGSGKQRGEVAAALQNVRWNPAMIVGSLESIKSLSLY